MLVKGTIGLGIRERKPVDNTDKYASSSVNSWLTSLPKANIGETARQIYRFLHDANQSLLTAQQRNTVTSSLLETAAFISESMEKHYIGMSVGLSEKQQKIANFSQALDVELSIAFKTIIEDLIVDEKYQSELLVRAVNACLYYFYHIQTRCYQLYRDLPSGMWHEIHVLYQLAEQNQFHDQRIELAKNHLSITATYKNILLLATINPNQLRQQEISKIAVSMGKISHQTRLDSDPSESHDFIVNLKSDSGPFHHSLMSGEMKAHYRGISLNNVIETLESELQHKAPEQRILKLEDQTQRHLLNSWGTMTTRTFAREDGSGHLTVTLGLAASHYLISDTLYGEDVVAGDLSGEKLIDSLEGSMKNAVVLGGDDEGEITRPGPRTSSDSADIADPAAKLIESKIWDATFRNRAVQDTQNQHKPYRFMESSGDDNPTKYNTQEATIINISPGGYCLRLDTPFPKQTQTGEIIGLLEHTANDEIHWNIGSIRWIKRKSTSELEIGVQLIAPNGAPVRAQMRTSHSDDNNYQRCLELPAIENLGQPVTLLTSPLPFREQAKVRVKTYDDTYDVLLVNEIASSHSFKQFIFEKLQNTPDGDMKDKSDDFDSVWKLI